ncbi:MAG: exodeoxyribonuclease III [Coriobacteriaceae bacterium]|nr:exodeoxyribonuclease III [Coriobacteriaceae bacterium]
MKCVSWNVNGLRAVAKKGFDEIFASFDADIFALQETKLQEGQNPIDFEGYHEYWNYAEKKGYSGTAVFAKEEPLAVTRGIGVEELDHEGRVLTLEYPEFFFVCVYTPNAQNELARIDFRCAWEDGFRAYLTGLAQRKGVIVCGDMNVAHNPIDLARPKQNEGNAGYSEQERGKFNELLDAGFVDTFRTLHPNEQVYSWWSYRMKARERNVGWRIDYFLVSEDLQDKLTADCIHSDVLGSDHCPVSIEIF